MRKLQKILIWYYMFCKRLLHKWSFCILLCMIPVIVPLVNTAMTDGESGVLKIILCADEENRFAQNIIKTLTEDDGIISYSVYSSETEAEEAVRDFKADAAWILPEDISEQIDKYSEGKMEEPFVRVIEREDTTPLKIARELLYGAMYNEISYHTYKNFVYSDIVSEDVPEEEIREYYDSTKRRASILELKYLNSDKEVERNTNYLSSPLRGILSVMIMLCTLAAAMYFLKDRVDGKYNWMQPRMRIVPAFASCFAAAVFAAVVVLAALYISGIFTGFGAELLSMFLFVIAATGFALLMCMIFGSAGRLGAVLPGLIIVMLALSPIFFNVKVLPWVRICLPTHYYIYSIYNKVYYLQSVLYIAVVYSLVFFLNYITAGIKQKSFSIK